ncbi:ricin-type beta-trefoil lectin domain protein [Glycomyces sp. NPDC047369]
MEPWPPPAPRGPRHASPNDLPARLRERFERARMRLGTSQTMAGVAAVVALVLTVAVVAAVMAAGGGDEPEAAAQDVDTSLASTPSPSDSPSASPSPSPSPSPSATTAEEAADAPRNTTEEPEPEAPEPEPEYPADGWYQIKQEASGLCLSTGPEPNNEGRTVVVLASCGSTNPATLQVVAWDEGVYVFNMHFSDWSACMGADAPADQEGYLMAAYSCEFTETQFWELTPLGGGEYAIKTSASGLCMGILEGRSSTSGEPTATDSCDSGNAAQRFSLV